MKKQITLKKRIYIYLFRNLRVNVWITNLQKYPKQNSLVVIWLRVIWNSKMISLKAPPVVILVSWTFRARTSVWNLWKNIRNFDVTNLTSFTQNLVLNRVNLFLASKKIRNRLKNNQKAYIYVFCSLRVKYFFCH